MRGKTWRFGKAAADTAPRRLFFWIDLRTPGDDSKQVAPAFDSPSPAGNPFTFQSPNAMKLFIALTAFVAFAASLSAQAPPSQTARAADPIAGDWRWFNGTLVHMTDDGRCAGPKNRGTWEFSNNKEVERKYVVKWEENLFIDYLTLSRDGRHLTGKSAKGDRVSADKIERAAPSAAPPPPVASAVPKLGVAQESVKGSFYVSVDDEASIFINGGKVHSARINESRSPELELKTTDRVIVHLHNTTAEHRFMMVFVSSDQARIVSFHARDFRLVPDPGVTDFTPDQFQRWNKQPRPERHENRLPVKSYSDWVWSDLDDGIIASVVTSQMMTQKPK